MSASSEPRVARPSEQPLPESLVEVKDSLLSLASDALLAHGRAIPHAVLFDEKGGVSVLASEPFDAISSKDRFAAAIRMMSLEVKAVRLGFMSEVWAFEARDEAHFNEFKKWREEVGDSASFNDFPGGGIKEHIFINIESFEGHATVVATIQRRPTPDTPPYILKDDAKITYFDAETLATLKPAMSGRFTHLLAPREMWDTEEAKMIVAVGRAVMSGHMHDLMDDEAVERLKEALGENNDSPVPQSSVLPN